MDVPIDKPRKLLMKSASLSIGKNVSTKGHVLFDREIAQALAVLQVAVIVVVVVAVVVVVVVVGMGTFVLIELYDAILLRISKSDSDSEY